MASLPEQKSALLIVDLQNDFIPPSGFISFFPRSSPFFSPLFHSFLTLSLCFIFCFIQVP